MGNEQSPLRVEAPHPVGEPQVNEQSPLRVDEPQVGEPQVGEGPPPQGVYPRFAPPPPGFFHNGRNPIDDNARQAIVERVRVSRHCTFGAFGAGALAFFSMGIPLAVATGGGAIGFIFIVLGIISAVMAIKEVFNKKREEEISGENPDDIPLLEPHEPQEGFDGNDRMYIPPAAPY